VLWPVLTWIRFAICDTDGEYEFKLKSLAKMLQEPWVKQEVRAQKVSEERYRTSDLRVPLSAT
jgi:hypothetical protein